MTDARIDGHVEPGFGAVADTFRRNVEQRGDTGAACTVYVQGRPVVDIWTGSTADGTWTRDTRSLVFSVSKGITTVCLLMAVEQGLLDLDAPVASYWPQFATRGKERTTVRQVLAHQAGLLAPEVRLTLGDLLTWTPVADALAEQAPAWTPGTAHAYHALTFGWLAGEVLRRASGLRPSEWLQSEIAGPLKLSMSYGADPVAPDYCPTLEPLPDADPDAAATVAAQLADPLILRSLSLGGLVDVADLFGSLGSPGLLTAELPAANVVTNAHSIARLYAATVGTVDGVRLLAADTIRDARQVRSAGAPFVGSDAGNRWGTGFMVSSPARRMLGEGSFGHDGAGGHLGFGHLEHEVGFGYQTSRPGGRPDDRADALCRALRRCLG